VPPSYRAHTHAIPLACGALAAVGYWGIGAAAAPQAKRVLGPVLLSRAATGRDEVALTFDDGPDPRMTPRFLEALDGTPATFFWLGRSVRRWPWLVEDAAARGHEVGCHGDDHRCLATLGPRATVGSLRRARDAIRAVTGTAPAFYRPAYGVWNLAAWGAAPRLGMRRTLWSRWAWDWQPSATPELIASRILTDVRPGSVLLLHDAQGSPGATERTLAALPAVLAGLRERGLRPVTLSRLVA
jgi:peptidoglycan-N-acetylglucosamine deacetylase